MLNSKKVVCIIPARLASTRFPEKVLQSLAGKPVLQWVWEAAKKVSLFDECHFAIDDVKIANLLDRFGASWFMTSRSAEAGTDRLIEIMDRKLVSSDIWVNWQGDEPFINAEMIEDLLQTAAHDGMDVWTLKKLITIKEQIKGTNTAKVVTDNKGNALYFSRSPVPFYRDHDFEQGVFYKHVGLYAFTTKGLQMMQQLPIGKLEQAEKLEMLRLLENGIKIRLHETLFEARGIDTPEDLRYAEITVQSKNITVSKIT
jgi:3-deoxy-manno-octulosonate cytidylyltransferase (CMP-KDO synthetase)